MKRMKYKVLLGALRVLVYSKRFFFWTFFSVYRGLDKTADWVGRKTGFHVYKFRIFLKKFFSCFYLPGDRRFIEWIGTRNTLQMILLFVTVVSLVPHSKLYSRDQSVVAGRETLLFAMVGYQDIGSDIDELVIDMTATSNNGDTRSYHEGAVLVETPSAVGTLTKPNQEISGVSAGGTAVTKPTIFPGSVLPTGTENNSTTRRTQSIIYVVKSGDVVGTIASTYGISVNTLLWANNLTARSYIRPGDELTIPPVTGVLHKVKSGDTIGKIARLYDAKQEDIVTFNKLKNDGSDIVIDEVLMVPDGAKPQVVTVPVASNNTFRSVSAPPPSVTAPAGSGYLWPTSVRRISQYFGALHTGLDIAGPAGTSLYASRTGTVIKSQCGYNGGYGCYIIIDHGDGVQTIYGHASKLLVSVGDTVTQGQSIALMGSTGRSTGSHIHFEVRVNGSRQNPLKYIR